MMGGLFNCLKRGFICLKRSLIYLKRIALCVLNLRLWQISIIVLVCILGYWVWITYGSWRGSGTKPQPDTPINDIKRFDKRLDAFRAKWDIYGRFEAWPAVLPLAEISKNAYLSENEAKRLFAQYGLTSVVSICSPFHSQCVYVASGEDVLVVVFRGTDDTEDWFFNANTYPHKMSEGSLHGGFGCAYGTVRTEVLNEIEKAKPQHIWVTGHSLGGAMAAVFAYDLVVYRNRKIDGVITFGQPRIAKHNLSTCLQQNLGDRYAHFINELDSVPQIPRSFEHFGLELQFLNGKVRKSEEYFPKLVMASPNANEPGLDDYIPSKGVPEMSQKDFEDFLQKRRRVLEQNEKPEERQDDEHGSLRARSGPLECAFPFPWVDDHDMNLYCEKIKAAIDKASGH